MDRLAAMQTFVKVIETGSFSAAARQLRVGQPAVSKTVAQLRREGSGLHSSCARRAASARPKRGGSSTNARSSPSPRPTRRSSPRAAPARPCRPPAGQRSGDVHPLEDRTEAWPLSCPASQARDRARPRRPQCRSRRRGRRRRPAHGGADEFRIDGPQDRPQSPAGRGHARRILRALARRSSRAISIGTRRSSTPSAAAARPGRSSRTASRRASRSAAASLDGG